MNRIDATAVIWGNDNYNVLGLLRQLSPFIDNVIFLVNQRKNRCATWSRYCKKYVLAKTYEDGISFLKSFGNTLGNKGFLFTTNDTLAEYVDRNSNLLSHYYYLMGSKRQGLLTEMQGKSAMTKLADEIGFITPRSLALKSVTNIDTIVYPCVVKPDNQTNKYKCNFKIRHFENKNELESFQQGMDKDDKYIVQQFIKKEKEYLLYGCRLLTGEVIIPGTIEKDRWHHGMISSKIPQTVNLDLIKTFLEKIEFYGLFSFEFGLYDGKSYFFEVNLRNDGTSLYYFLGGANLPLLWVTSICGYKNFYSCSVRGESFFIDGIGDLPSALRGDISLKKWWSDLKNADMYRHYSAKDKKPFLGVAMTNIPRMLIKYLLGLYKHQQKDE